MSYQSATTTAPDDADFVVYKEVNGYTFLQRDDDTSWGVIANADVVAYALIATGISETHRSLWDFDRQQFVCGTVDQLTRTDWETAA